MDGSFAVQALIDSLSTAEQVPLCSHLPLSLTVCLQSQISTLFTALQPAIERLITSRSGYFVILRSLEVRALHFAFHFAVLLLGSCL